ncbi:type IX secretion system protein PorQ [Ekhidna sp. To15]|uniref:type IX secretion system protein PorQ n=1 Tax=Ekhidna sp. To15 TaxID=3395267 RepID=UPI003F522F80
MRVFIFIACFAPLLSWSQIGGQLGYQSLNLTTNPRAAALAGSTISLADGDISQFFENPATLDSVGAKNIFLQVNPYFADVFVYSGAYTFNIASMGTFAAGLTYVNFGSFEMTDESGNNLGTFQAQDYTFQIGKAHQLGPFTLGANIKLAHSSIESYGSTAFLMDIGGVFRVNKHWTVAMVFENIGARITEYSSFSSPKVPFDVKLGTTFKPQYMPLRFTVTSTNLIDDDFVEEDDATGRSNKTLDRVWKRINLGAEVLLSKNFQLLVGYNHKRKQELRLSEIGGGAGFSYGMMVRIKRIELRFSRATYHAAGGSSFISMRTDLNDFKKIL